MSDDRQEPPVGDDDDLTRPLPADADRPGPPADQTAPIPPPWSGRAEVRSPRPDDSAGEWYVEEQGGRRWWLPILWGVLALLLAGLLGGALWLVRDQQEDDRNDRGLTPSLPPTTDSGRSTPSSGENRPQSACHGRRSPIPDGASR